MLIVTVLAASLASVGAAAAEATCDLELTNAQIWNGAGFDPATIQVSGNRIVDMPGVTCRQHMDLSGQFVSPAFGEGHTHNVEARWNLNSLNQRYQSEGVYYVQNPVARATTVAQIIGELEPPEMIDVTFAMGAITSFRGHPEPGYLIYLSDILYGGANREDLAGDAFHTVMIEADIPRALDELERQGADFVKIVLENSSRYEEVSARVSDDDFWRGLLADIESGQLTDQEEIDALTDIRLGLNPEFVPQLVSQAHERGLRVFAHIGNAADFAVAIHGGVDVIGHMPGAYLAAGEEIEDFRLDETILRVAAENRVPVILTANVRPEFITNESRNLIYEMQRQNIAAMQEAGIPVLIGTDRWDAMPSSEVSFLIEQNMLSPSQAFEAWIETGQYIFPQRQIGCLEAGCEADMLVFPTDPRTSLDAMLNISLRIKQGLVLETEGNQSNTQVD